MNWQKRFFEKVNKMNSLKQERGSILVLTVILLPIMFAFLGFAFDFGNIYMHKARLQNVADAAALAGARAYLNSQTNEDPNDRDSVDGIVDRTGGKLAANSSATYKEGRSTPDVYNVRDTQKTKNRDYSNHKAADRAADEYIYHNIANLGNVVKSDRWSHYAINSDNTDPKTFYRVGLYEEVPLYFLPIIQSIGKTQTVRAGAIAVVEKGTPTNPGGGGTTTITNSSIFDNLFTYSEYFDPGSSNANDIIKSTFNGNMVFTYGDGDSDQEHFYDIDKILSWQAQSVDHLFTNSMTDADIPDIRNSSSSAKWSYVNDPVINTFFKTTAYVDAFKKKLTEPHVVAGKNSLTDENINNENSDLYNSFVFIDGKVVHKGNTALKTPFIFDGGEYYACDVNTEDYIYVNGAAHTPENRVVYKQSNNKYFLTLKDGNKYYLLNKNYVKTNCYIEGWEAKMVNGTSIVSISSDDQGWFFQNESTNWQKIYLNNNLSLLNPSGIELLAGISEQFNPQQNQSSFYRKHIISDFFYLAYETNDYTKQADITIDGPITIGDDVNKPIYIMVDEAINGQVNLKVVNNVRPIVFVYLGNKNVTLNLGDNQNDVTKLTVYAPYTTVGYSPDNDPIHISGTYKGNIISRRIAIHANSSGTWIQENFLGDDEEIKKIDSKIEKEIKDATRLTDEIRDKVYDAYAAKLGVDKDAMADPNWYSKQNYNNKQALYHAWQELVEKFPAYKDLLWPWNEHFNIEQSEEPVATDGTLRLINYRTDYLDNGQANAVVDPFIFLSLEKPDAY